MTRSICLAALATLTLSGAAVAQQQGGVAPGGADASKVVSANRDQNANYNKLVGTLGGTRSKPVPATAADIKAGNGLRDIKGVAIGTIESVDGQSAVVATAKTRIKVPLIAFGKDDGGLLLGITADRFAELVAKATATN